MTYRKYGDRKVVDLSEWGRPIARVVARNLKDTPVSVMQVTNLHLALTLFCAWLILQGHPVVACGLLVVKGVIDAVDGELARVRNRPSHVGRYWDTVADTIGMMAIMLAFARVFDWAVWLTGGLILATLFQYSLFNHYSVLLRSLGSGDSTSRVDERIRPVANPWEKQSNVNVLHTIYLLFFSWQDRIIAGLYGKGSPTLVFELTVSSALGFGLQSLVILALAIMNSLAYLPELVLGFNMILMGLVLVRSRL